MRNAALACGEHLETWWTETVGELLSVRIAHIRLSAASASHESITGLRWTTEGDSRTGASSKASLVAWIDDKDGHAYVGSTNERATVGVVKPAGRLPYLRTYTDEAWNNNLLWLPRF